MSLHSVTTGEKVVIQFADRDHRLRLPPQKSGIPGCNDRQTYTRTIVSRISERTQIQGLGLLFDLLVSHSLSPCDNLHRVLLLQSPLIYVHVWTLDWRSDLRDPIQSARGVTKLCVDDQKKCWRTWTKTSNRSHHFAYSARRWFTSSTCSRAYIETSNVCSSPSGT